MPDVGVAARTAVRSRARYRCEYCLVPESLTLASHEIDHIIATKHAGATKLAGGTGTENLALCCTLCNKHKGTDLSSIDPETGDMCRLFHPRRDQWHQHFELRRGEILALTPVGRVTVRLLRLNRPERTSEREIMIRAGLLSP
jgi:hypothetical protein